MNIPIPVKTRLALILDPTVAQKQWGDDLLDGVEGLVKENSEVPVWFVDQQMVSRAEPTILTFPFDDRQKTNAQHELRVVQQFRTLKQEYERRWEAAHSSDAVTRPASCLLTALQQFSAYLRERDETHWKTDLLVGSDLLEACSDWGSSINLERGIPADLQVTQAMKESIDLSQVTSTIVLVARSTKVRTPEAEMNLENEWSAVLRALGAKGPWIGREIGAAREHLEHDSSEGAAGVRSTPAGG